MIKNPKIRAYFNILTLFSSIILCIQFSTKEANAANETVIDLLVLYTPGLAAAYDGDATTRIEHLITVSNQIYADSTLNVRLRVVHSLEINYPDGGSSTNALREATQGSGVFSNISALRTEYGADMVVIYRPYQYDHGNCGVAWVGGNKTNGDFSGVWANYMVAHISATVCPAYVTAHELGHNMGLYHSRKQDQAGGTFHYSLGHGVNNEFVTIMAYPNEFNVPWDIGVQYKLSSPDLDCGGSPCGIDKNDTVNGADALATLIVSTPQISAFYATKVADPDAGGGTGGGTTTDPGTDTGTGGGTTDESEEVRIAREAMEAALAELEAAINTLDTAEQRKLDLETRIEELGTTIDTLKAQRSAVYNDYQDAREEYYSARLKLQDAESAQRSDSSVDISTEQQAYDTALENYTNLRSQRDNLDQTLDDTADERTQAKTDKRQARRDIFDAKSDYRQKRRAYKSAQRTYENLVDASQSAPIAS